MARWSSKDSSRHRQPDRLGPFLDVALVLQPGVNVIKLLIVVLLTHQQDKLQHLSPVCLFLVSKSKEATTRMKCPTLTQTFSGLMSQCSSVSLGPYLGAPLIGKA